MAKKNLDYVGLAHLIEKLIKRQFQSKGLSTEDFTTALKNKLAALPTSFVSQADVTALSTKVAALEALIESDSDGAINKFNEIVNFLAGVVDTKTLQGMLADIASQISAVDAKANSNASELDKVSGKVDDILAAMPDAATVAAHGTKIANLETGQEGILNAISDMNTTLGTAVQESDLVSITNAEIDALIAAGGVLS